MLSLDTTLASDKPSTSDPEYHCYRLSDNRGKNREQGNAGGILFSALIAAEFPSTNDLIFYFYKTQGHLYGQ